MSTVNTSSPSVYDLSKRMFWDTPIENVDWYDHRHFIVERVMRYGRLEDWKQIKQWYGYDGLREIAIKVKNLDRISIAFLSLVLDIKKEEFKCYTEEPSRRSFWSY